MNYLKQINAFHLKIDLEPISVNARSLWFTLMDINNRLGWKEDFTVAVSTLIAKAGLAETPLRRARKELEDNGFIHVTSGSGNKAAAYRMVCLYENKADNLNGKTEVKKEDTVQQEQTTADNLEDKVEGIPTPFFKHKQKNKQKKTNTTDAARFYQENFGVITAYVADDLLNWTNDVGDALVLEALKRALERNKASWGYVKSILKNWAKKGITTVKQAHAEEVAFYNQQQQKQPYRSGGGGNYQQEIVPDWFREREQKKSLADKPVSKDEQRELEKVDRMLAKLKSEKHEG
ncbi:DnaD domain protein [Virgibacillus sp. NKC19-16]|uniref:DnaD domain-containing protein n=1 Tax=Virgibacillus salidurans TaxID=2831673 RepID=UPI001F3D21FA|nr:DnaD domain protein [Virgibacillus sp. NKC19-16]UJL46278.1 DnaD domain protein [Virgibacillus sp. NKC19-16]